jgi:DNA/RNA-binding domain of Phe-tRNA-synthetase-like protein
MRISIDPELKAKSPRVALGVVTASIHVGESPAELLEALTAAEAKIHELPEPRAVLESPPVLATRAGYRALGKDPARYRGSAEALLRRVLSGKNLPHINVVVDIINLVSVHSRLSIGLYDLGKVEGDIVFRAGRAGESYKGIGKYDLNLEDLPLFSDSLGPHGSPTSDSERTMVTPETTQVAAILISFGGSENLDRWLQMLADLFQKYAVGRDLSTETIT